MSCSTLIIGSNGNMGSRYRAILNYLDVPFWGYDINDANGDTLENLVPYTAKIIVATPTKTHFDVLRQIHWIRSGVLAPNKLDVLCEKPVTKSLDELAEIKKFKFNTYCVNQYNYLPRPEFMAGETYYNYFKSGQDGLAWDCFPLFVLAKENVGLDNSSPIWHCGINGFGISIQHMDWAYMEMINDFLGPMEEVWNLDVVEAGMKKVLQWIEDQKNQS